MDDIVKAALAKWPNVPHCHGWLALDARGQWFMRDDRVQAAGAFPQVKGSRIEHDKLLAFIQRNYDHDADGCWYFQNGPQRVYVELEITPWIWRVEPDGRLTSHTGRSATFEQAYLDAQGRLYVNTDLGIGLVHTQDMHVAAELVQSSTWAPIDIDAATLPQHFGFEPSPQRRLAPGVTPPTPA